ESAEDLVDPVAVEFAGGVPGRGCGPTAVVPPANVDGAAAVEGEAHFGVCRQDERKDLLAALAPASAVESDVLGVTSRVVGFALSGCFDDKLFEVDHRVSPAFQGKGPRPVVPVGRASTVSEGVRCGRYKRGQAWGRPRPPRLDISRKGYLSHQRAAVGLLAAPGPCRRRGSGPCTGARSARRRA